MLNQMLLGEPIGQSWLQLSELALAFVLSALIGLEREIGQKSAGLRTYTLVGISSALIMLVSKYGFTDILESGRVVLDPSVSPPITMRPSSGSRPPWVWPLERAFRSSPSP